MRGPVISDDSVFVCEVPELALVFAGIYRPGVYSGLYLGHYVGRGRPEVDHAGLADVPLYDAEVVLPVALGRARWPLVHGHYELPGLFYLVHAPLGRLWRVQVHVFGDERD